MTSQASYDSPLDVGEPRRTALEAVFGNRDILDNVLLSAYPHDPESDLIYSPRKRWLDPSTKNQHLLWAALTCRSFFESAMDILWHVMLSLRPLLDTIPILARENDAYVMHGSLEERHLERFDIYARRIRILSHLSNDVLPSLFLFLLSYLRPRGFCPALKDLKVHGWLTKDSINSLMVLFPLQSPCLTRLKFSTIIDDEANMFLASFLTTVPFKAPAITRATINGQLSIDALKSLSGLRQLNYLDIIFKNQVPEYDAFRVLSSIDTLTSLVIRFLKEQQDSRQWTQSISFPDLKSLDITGAATSLSRILSGVEADQLETLKLKQRGPPQQIRRFDLLNRTPSIKNIHFSFDETQRVSEDLFIPLLHLDLHQLLLEGYRWSLVDSVIKDLFNRSSWSNLVILTLHTSTSKNSHPNPNSYPSLLSLRHIAINCPKLQSLHVAINLQLADPAALQANIQQYRMGWTHPLAVLDLGSVSSSNRTSTSSGVDTPPGQHQYLMTSSSMKLAISVGRYIDHVFPMLTELRRCGLNDREWWDVVRSLVASNREIRQEVIAVTTRSLSLA